MVPFSPIPLASTFPKVKDEGVALKSSFPFFGTHLRLWDILVKERGNSLFLKYKEI